MQSDFERQNWNTTGKQVRNHSYKQTINKPERLCPNSSKKTILLGQTGDF